MNLHSKLLLIILMPLLISGCCRSPRCAQISTDPAKIPIATIKITYTDSEGTQQNIMHTFDGSSSSVNHSVELPSNVDWTAYFRAKSSGALNKFQTKWRHEKNDNVQYQEPWQINDFTPCPKKCWDRKLEFQDSVYGDVYGLHIYAEGWNNKNTGRGNVYVRFVRPTEPDPEPEPVPSPTCEASGTITLTLDLDPEPGLTPKWKNHIPIHALEGFCEELFITNAILPRKVKCSTAKTVCISEWSITIGEETSSGFTCDEDDGNCELVFENPIPFNTTYEIEASPSTYFPCEEPDHGCDGSAWENSISLDLEIE